ncbi:SLAP domain-containing protein [Lactobacillus sp. ESL0791]|uniref:SLAP domain-containing protein n=1 Tax=Lactobacillus sp. ESL0791 TaxID=2983234 RepID=UPI0023F6E07E|nr:SLAP domain-containing protein [Lactobacillus sp. ESL0791]MDF7639604.1 SLAP domain-containing protein [Lactobacillus sp. ESL0791]
MKLNKKLIITTIAAVLALGVSVPAIEHSATSALAATSSTNTMQLAHGAYVYNKNGKRLKKYRGSRYKTHLRKGTNVQYAGTVESIDHDSKQYYLLNDDNYNQSWLPYIKVKGKYYYSIGHGGYINAANVSEINGQPLYVATATVTVYDKDYSKPYTTGTGSSKVTIQNGKKVKIDYVFSDIDGNSRENYYHIANTNDAYIGAFSVKTRLRQRLATQTKDTYIEFIKPTVAYNLQSILNPSSNSEVVTIGKDLVNAKQAIELLYIWVRQNNKAELFYRLGDTTNYDTINVGNATDNNLFYVKAEDTRYVSGPRLTPINTAEEAREDAKVATEPDKQDLQKSIIQEATVKSSDNYNNYEFFSELYDQYLKLESNKTSQIPCGL